MGLLARIPAYTSKLWPRAQPEPMQKEEAKQRLGLAAAQRSLMVVTFQNPEFASMDFSGPCFRISGNTLFIDSPCHTRYSACYGEAVNVFFSLGDNNSTTFFQFASTIQGYKPGCGFALEVPAELRLSQRREFLRIPPPAGTFLHMKVWPIEGEDLSQLSFSAATQEGFPDNGTDARLVNISAGGLCIHIKHRPDAPVVSSGPDSRLLVFLRLKDIATRRPLPPAYANKTPGSAIRQTNANILNLRLACTVRYRTEETELSRAIFGLNFIAWVVPGSGENKPVWSKTGDGGEIPLLTDWVWQHQLALVARNRRNSF